MNIWAIVLVLVSSIIIRIITSFEHKRSNVRIWDEISLFADCVIAGSALWLFFYIMW